VLDELDELVDVDAAVLVTLLRLETVDMGSLRRELVGRSVADGRPRKLLRIQFIGFTERDGDGGRRFFAMRAMKSPPGNQVGNVSLRGNCYLSRAGGKNKRRRCCGDGVGRGYGLPPAAAGWLNLVRGRSDAGNSAHDPVGQMRWRADGVGCWLQGSPQGLHLGNGKACWVAFCQQNGGSLAIGLRPYRQIFAVFLEVFQKGRE